jgi:hypothetical protein
MKYGKWRSKRPWILAGAGFLTIGAVLVILRLTTPDLPGQNDPYGLEEYRRNLMELKAKTVGRLDCTDPFKGNLPGFSLRPWKTNFCKHSAPYEEIGSGGPDRDGIPPIDDPKWETVGQADEWLGPRNPVIGLSIANDSRAYPLQILIWHEIVNDEVGGKTVAVTFCPLCYTALVFERPVVNGNLLTFGTSGNLRESDLVMWDRQTESWWQQFTGEAIVGDLTGMRLKPIPAGIISWTDFKQRYPKGKALSRNTGKEREYESNPYVMYDRREEPPAMTEGPRVPQSEPMARVIGVVIRSQAKAYGLSALMDRSVINDEIASTPIVVFWKEGTASATDSRIISEGRELGSTRIYLRTVGGKPYTFARLANGRFVDEQTRSEWNIFGEAISGPLKGNKLEQVFHYETFLFAWKAFLPGSPLWGLGAGNPQGSN